MVFDRNRFLVPGYNSGVNEEIRRIQETLDYYAKELNMATIKKSPTGWENSYNTSYDKPQTITEEEYKAFPVAAKGVVFPLSDLLSFARALKANKRTCVTRYNYNGLIRSQVEKPGEYVIKLEDFVKHFADYYLMRGHLFNGELSNHFNNRFAYHAERQAFNSARASSATNRNGYKEFTGKVHKRLRPTWVPNPQYFVEVISNTFLGKKLKPGAVTFERKFFWLQHEQMFVLTLDLDSLVQTGTFGLVTKQAADRDFFKCETEGCLNWGLNTEKRTFLIQAASDRTDDTLEQAKTRVKEKSVACCRGCYDTYRGRYGADQRTPSYIHSYTSNPLTLVEDGNNFRRAKGEHVTANTIYLGVELEVVASKFVRKFDPLNWLNTAARVCDANLRYKNKMGILKSDSSIGPEGFEIVSVPGTHLAHTTEMWEDFFREDGPHRTVAGWNHKQCGMHIHVGRNALTSFHIGKMSVFITAKNNREFVEHIAGRKECDYSKFYDKKLKDGEHSNRRGEDRRQALNLQTGKPTVEFRIFRSNTSKHGFMKNIDFVHALCVWSRDCSAAVLTHPTEPSYKDFIAWCDKNRGSYKYLTEWLVKHKYLTERHKFNPKYQQPILMEA